MIEVEKINRAPIRTEVEVTSELLGVTKANTVELSDVGAFIESKTLQQLDTGTIVSIQAVGFPEPMPVLEAKVVAVTRKGVDIRFLL